MSQLTTKSTKIEVRIQDPTKHSYKTRKAQECHLAEGKLQKPVKGKKSSKAMQNDKENVKIRKLNTPPEINSP
jgi:hypothetical protein